MHILIVEDDPRVADFLDRGLRAEGYRVQLARNGTDGLAQARLLAQQSREEDSPAVMLLDVMLPGMGGLEVCQTLRAAGVALPILMLTALGTLEDRVSGLRLGADDYLVKPFAFEELLARIEALMRRSRDVAPASASRLVVADLVLDRDAMRVTQLIGERFEPIEPSRGQDERVPAQGELARERGADAGRSAGDEGIAGCRRLHVASVRPDRRKGNTAAPTGGCGRRLRWPKSASS